MKLIVAMSETSSGNALDETEENGFDWERRNNFISNSYPLQEQARKKSENSLQNMCTIQSSTSEAESSPDVELFIELVKQFPVIWNPKLNFFKDSKKKNAWNQINTAPVGAFQIRLFCISFFNKGVNASFFSVISFFIKSFL